MNGVASITANDGRQADAALVRRFRQAQTKRERTAVFADVIRQHRDALLSSCAERLWPDADAAVAAAGKVLVAARLAMADPTKSPHPNRLRDWLLGIAAQDWVMPGVPVRIDDINWEAVHARIAADVPETRNSPARPVSPRHWLEQIVVTLPEPRQRMYDLFVARGLDSRSAALELGSGVAEVRRLRRENRQAILRAFEVTALAAAEAAPDEPWSEAPGCRELRQILADAQHDGNPHEAGRRHIVVLPAAMRLALSRHLSQCTTCQDRRDDCMARWAPELLPILAGAELYEQVMEDLQSMPEPGQPGSAPGAHRRDSSVGTARIVVARRVAAAAGAGLLVALLAFVWPGFLHGKQGSISPASQALSSGGPSGSAAPQGVGTVAGVAGDKHGQPVRRGPSGLLNSLPPVATGSSAASPYASLPPFVSYTVQPSTSPTSSAGQPSSGSSPATPSPSASSAPPKATAPAPSPVRSTTQAATPSSQSPSATPSSPAPSKTTSPTPSAAPSTPASPTPSSPAPSTSSAATSATDPAPSTVPASSTPSPSDSATTAGQ